jgi:hypothetical protein
MIAAIQSDVMNENSMTRTRATMKCAGWSMNSLLMVMLLVLQCVLLVHLQLL